MDPILDFVSVFAEGVLLAIAPVLASMVAAWLIAQVKTAWAKAREAAGEWVWVLDAIADKAVQAAEQANMAGLIQDKKAYALDLAQQFLSEQGYKIDVSLIDAAIEAAVLEQFNKGRER